MSATLNKEEKYQLTVSPSSFYEVRGNPGIATCVIDNEQLELLDRFDDTVVNGIQSGFYYSGNFMMCPTCGHAHYIVDHADHLQGPVTLQWKK